MNGNVHNAANNLLGIEIRAEDVKKLRGHPQDDIVKCIGSPPIGIELAKAKKPNNAFNHDLCRPADNREIPHGSCVESYYLVKAGKGRLTQR